jgi:hypothetical protein
VSKRRRAVTHTDERINNTPVRNQFQELSEHQGDQTTTPSLAPKKLIVEFTRQSATDPSDSSSGSSNNGSSEDGNSDIPEEAEASDTGSINNSSSSNNESSKTDSSSRNNGNNSNDGDNSNENASDTGSIGSTESFDTMTNITSDYGSLMETIRLVNAEQAKVFSGKKKNFREVLGSALTTIPCTTHDYGYSWLVETKEDYTDRTGATTPYKVRPCPKDHQDPWNPHNPLHPKHTSNTQSTNKNITNTSTGTRKH